ncbi:MAG: VWA domain-containing protein [Eubacteriaceae bacterium]|nr:VWA domain-containing protein [Eubacteriaceae bacterium]
MKKRVTLCVVIAMVMMALLPVFVMAQETQPQPPANVAAERDGLSPDSAARAASQDYDSAIARMGEEAKQEGSADVPMVFADDATSEITTQAASKPLYIVLALDVSNSMDGTPLNVEKIAAKNFVSKVMAQSSQNRIAIVKFSESVSTACGFTNNTSYLNQIIDGLYVNGGTNINGALTVGDSLLAGADTTRSNKYIVLCSDGIPVSGTTSNSGPYYASDIDYYYTYANAAYRTAQSLHSKYYIRTLGFYHNLWGKELTFGKRFMRDLQNKGFYLVDDPNNLNITFENVADDIDTDTKTRATFDTGANVNTKIKRQAGDSSPSVASVNQSISEIRFVSNKSLVPSSGTFTLSAPGSAKPIICWISGGVLYCYSEDAGPLLNGDCSWMFSGLAGVKTIDLAYCDASQVANTSHMFDGCRSLSSIVVSDDCDMTHVRNSSDMFKNCDSLVGGAGTAYNGGNGSNYARIDGSGSRGYFTRFTNYNNNTSQTMGIAYRTHVQNIGWQPFVRNGATAGTSGRGYRLEAMRVQLENQPYSGSVEYRTHIENIGWESSFRANGQNSGTSGRGYRLEAMQVRLTGEMASHYDVYYRVHAQNFGWLGWAKNGAEAGTAGYGYRLEAMQVMLVAKGGRAPSISPASRDSRAFVQKGGSAPAPSAGPTPTVNPSPSTTPSPSTNPTPTPTPTPSTNPAATRQSVVYSTHMQNIGWQQSVQNGAVSGAAGSGLRMEGLRMHLEKQEAAGNIEYRAHMTGSGWESPWRKNDEVSGSVGSGKQMEAVQICLTGLMSFRYDVYYRVHVQDIGWLGWAKNGEQTGTEGLSKRVEALQVALVAKGSALPSYSPASVDSRAFIRKGDPAPGSSSTGQSVAYQANVQNIGWQPAVRNGAVAGTTGQGLRMEGLTVKLENQLQDGNIEYRAHVQNVGWEDKWKTDGAKAGTQGKGLAMEALQIRLIGNMAFFYDVYYRVYAQNVGWLGWAKNGAEAGTAGYGYRLEAAQVVLVPKDTGAPTGYAASNRAEAYLKK